MVNVLVVLALVLAWPTYGISLILLIAVPILLGKLSRKANAVKAHYMKAQADAYRHVKTGAIEQPSWINNPALQKQLIIETTQSAMQTGLTEAQVKRWFTQQSVANSLMTACAVFERSGLSKPQQLVAMADFTARLATEQRNHITHEAPSAYALAKLQFEEGMRQALAFNTHDALACYTRSIELCENPAPLINRAKIYSNRIRHYEALQDLSEALRIDRTQGNEFLAELNNEIRHATLVTQHYRTDTRERLLNDLNTNNFAHVAGRIACVSFDISDIEWSSEMLHSDLVEFHFFHDMSSILNYEQQDNYPDIFEIASRYDRAFIDYKSTACPDEQAYLLSEIKLHTFLCVYAEADMHRLRTIILYEIHKQLMNRDFGWTWNTLSSPCQGITREAETFMNDD